MNAQTAATCISERCKSGDERSKLSDGVERFDRKEASGRLAVTAADPTKGMPSSFEASTTLTRLSYRPQPTCLPFHSAAQLGELTLLVMSMRFLPKITHAYDQGVRPCDKHLLTSLPRSPRQALISIHTRRFVSIQHHVHAHPLSQRASSPKRPSFPIDQASFPAPGDVATTGRKDVMPHLEARGLWMI